MYPYYKGGKFTGYKQRVIESKQMFSKGDCKDAELFGSHVVKPNGKTLYITEGELDCVALYQILKELSGLPGWEPSVVSLSHGASSAAKDISTSMDFVDSFQKIVLCFDMDDAGQAAVDDACKLLAGKVYIAKYSEKDANEMLLKGKADELKWDVMKHAKMYMPDAIINYGDMWDRYTAGQERVSYPWPEQWKEMNQRTYGIRLGELVMVTSGSGMGKTQFLREVEDHYFRTTDFKIADIKLEEDLVDSMDGMMSLYLNKRIHLPDTVTTLEEKKEAFDFYYGSRRFSGYDYFGGLDNDNLFSKIRWFAATGHKIIFLDHLSIIVSEFASDGGERERIDTIMTKLAKMVKELNITIFLVVHLKKTDKQPFEEGHVPSLDDLRGSGTLKQLSMTVIALSRNQQHTDGFCANTSELTVLKCRFTGRTGTADYLNFNDLTGRMTQVPKPHNYRPAKKEFKPNFSAPSPY
jgi:twinkle protein